MNLSKKNNSSGENNRFLPSSIFPLLLVFKDYSSDSLKADLQAALNVALLAIPQGMAYALVSGLPIQYGLLGSAVAAIVGCIFSNSRFITLGPTNATSVLLFGVFASLGLINQEGMASERAIEILPWILFFSGCFLVLASILRISFMIQFVSRTVITAYVTAAAALIIANQIKHVLGLELDSNDSIATFWQIIYASLRVLSDFSSSALAVSGFTACCYLLLQYKLKMLPNVAITLILASVCNFIFEDRLGPVTTLAHFDSSLGIFSSIQLSTLQNYGGTILWASVAISLLCLLEGLSIGKSLAARAGERIQTNQETFAIGMGNVGCSLFSGMPASGSLTRSTLNIQSGAKTSASNLFAGIFVVAGYLSLGSVVSYVPVSALATLVIFIGASLIKGRQIQAVSRATRSDGITFSVTLLVGLLFSLQMAIFAGVVTSILLFLRKVAEPEMVEYGYNEAGELAELSTKSRRPEPEVSIVHVEGELFFAAADLFYEQIRRVGEDPNLRVLVLKLLNAHHLDATSVMALEELLDYLKEKNCHVLLCGVRRDVLRIIRNAGVLSRMNRKNIFPHSASNPTLSTAKAIKRAKYLTSGEQAKVTIFAEQKMN
ncbi:MAG: SulP family inorganic anion transporter [Opitutales bacterium]